MNGWYYKYILMSIKVGFGFFNVLPGIYVYISRTVVFLILASSLNTFSMYTW